MLSIGEYVMKVNEGICRVTELVQRSDGDEVRNYFLLVPISNESMSVYVPERAEYPGIRALMSPSEAEAFLSSVADIVPMTIENDKQREQIYKDALKSLELTQLVAVIRNMDKRAEERKQIGKKMTALDERYQKMMEEVILQELSFVLQKNRSDVLKLILQKISESGKERA